jgi:hypothetical protein
MSCKHCNSSSSGNSAELINSCDCTDPMCRTCLGKHINTNDESRCEKCKVEINVSLPLEELKLSLAKMPSYEHVTKKIDPKVIFKAYVFRIMFVFGYTFITEFVFDIISLIAILEDSDVTTGLKISMKQYLIGHCVISIIIMILMVLFGLFIKKLYNMSKKIKNMPTPLIIFLIINLCVRIAWAIVGSITLYLNSCQFDGFMCRITYIIVIESIIIPIIYLVVCFKDSL